MRRRWVIPIIVLAAVAAWWVRSGWAERTVEATVRRLLFHLADGFFVPALRFDRLDYQRPSSVGVENLRLTDEHGIDLIAAERLELHIARLPRGDRPMTFDTVTFVRPTVRIIVAPDGQVVGFSNLIKTADAPREQPREQTRTELRESLEMRRLVIDDGSIVIERAGEEPMIINGIHTAMDIEPAGDWYAFRFTSDRRPVMTLDAAGRFNLSTAAMTLDALTLTLDARHHDDPSLPPELRRLMKVHDVDGEVTLALSGDITLADPLASNAQMRLTMREGSLRVSPYRIDVAMLEFTAMLTQRLLTFKAVEAKLLDGRLSALGRMDLQDAGAVGVEITGDALNLSRLTTPQSPQDTSLRGVLDVDVRYAAPLSALLTQTRGNGSVQLTGGSFARVPVLSSIVHRMRGQPRSADTDKLRPKGDKADLAFQFDADRIRLSHINVEGSWFALRGFGDVRLTDLSMDLRLNGGPLGKLKNKTGIVGDMLAGIVDAVYTYRVTGKVGSPEVSVELGGGGKNKMKPEP